MGSSKLNRRDFLRGAATMAMGVSAIGFPTVARARSGSGRKLRCAFVGVAHRAGANLSRISAQEDKVEVVALCDVDRRYLGKASQEFPEAATYSDWRRMLERKDLDAVVVSTPDHTHAVAAKAALETGHHVYCEKPLTRTVSEAREVTQAARKSDRVTQIGTQIHAGDNYRRVVELIETGAIGAVKEVHVWVSASYGGMDLPESSAPVPDYLHYDLWLGPVPHRPYSPEYLPKDWRHWWAFGGGALADFGCHYMDLPHWALGLGYPERIEPVDGPPVHPESTPPWLVVRYQYPAREKEDGSARLPPVALTWYHGGRYPKEHISSDEYQDWKSGVLFIGEEGRILADYHRHKLLPEEKFADFEPPEPYIPDSIGHHAEWVEACLHGGTTTCAFDYSGPLTEAALLGNVAYRVGESLDWDGHKLQVTNTSEAERFIFPSYRDDWTL